MRRREFIALVGGAAIGSPLQLQAQQPRKHARIGFLNVRPNIPLFAAAYSGFSDELRQLGWIEGQNLIIEYRYTTDPGVDLAAQVAELVKSNIDALVAAGPEFVLQTAVGASHTIPIAMIAINFDPIARGYVSSLARPGGNVTGIFFRQLELAQKQLELLTQAFPERTKAAALYDELSADQFAAATRAAESLNLQFHGLKLENPPYDFEAAFRVLAQGSPQMLQVLSSGYFTPSQSLIASLAIQQRLPTMFIFKTYVEAGGLMSYGVDYVAMHRRIAAFVGKMLEGTKPADIPVEQSTRFEFVVNLKTAKAIDVQMPLSILLRADQVIE
jgi:putative tryptophan/tyrosine transport system substrate-binding protein